MKQYKILIMQGLVVTDLVPGRRCLINGRKCFTHKYKGEFRVSDLITGHAIASSLNSFKESKVKAIKKLNQKNAKTKLRIAEKTVIRNGYDLPLNKL